VRLRLEVELPRRPPPADLDVLRLVRAHRHRGVRRVGHARDELLDGELDVGEARLPARDRLVDVAHLGLEPLGLVLLALAHHRADALGGLVAPLLLLLELLDEPAALLVELEEAVEVPIVTAIVERLAELVGMLADPACVEHAAASPGGACGRGEYSEGGSGGVVSRAERWRDRSRPRHPAQ
jgi:hypothetical protein